MTALVAQTQPKWGRSLTLPIEPYSAPEIGKLYAKCDLAKFGLRFFIDGKLRYRRRDDGPSRQTAQSENAIKPGKCFMATHSTGQRRRAQRPPSLKAARQRAVSVQIEFDVAAVASMSRRSVSGAASRQLPSSERSPRQARIAQSWPRSSDEAADRLSARTPCASARPGSSGWSRASGRNGCSAPHSVSLTS